MGGGAGGGKGRKKIKWSGRREGGMERARGDREERTKKRGAEKEEMG